MKVKLCIYFVILLILLLLNSLMAEDMPEKVIVTIGDEKITMADLEKRIKLISPQYKNLFRSKRAQQDVLNRMVQTLLMAKEARSIGIDKKEDIALKIEDMVDNYLAEEYLKREITDKINVTEDEIQTYYQEHLKEFMEPEKIRVRHILIKFNPKGKPEDQIKAEMKAKELLDRVKAREDFAKVAREFSEDPNSKLKGGDLGYISRGRMPPDFDKVAFGLKPTEISPIVKTIFGLHIIKLEDRRPERTFELNQVRNQIENELKYRKQRTKMETRVQELMKKYGVVIHGEALKE